MDNSEKRRIGYEIRRTDINMRRFLDERAEGKAPPPGGRPTHNHRRIMNFLFDNREKEIFQKDIEEHFSISSATCSKTLKLIEKNGFIERRSVESDARLKRIVLTDKALEISDRIKSDLDDFEKRLEDGISEAELSVFFSVLDRVNRNISEGSYD